MSVYVALIIMVGAGLTLAAMFGAISQSRAVSSALESMARQPEASGKLQTAMIIGLAFIESLVIYVLVISFMLYMKLPVKFEDILGLTK